MLNQNFVFLGSAFVVAGTIDYLIATLRGKVKPNKISFLMWSLAPLIAFVAEIKQGVGLVSLMTLTPGLMSFVLFLASFLNKKAEWKVRKFDVYCGLLSALGLVLWQVTRVGNIAILLSIFADGMAAVPTVVKSCHHPETEIAWPWLATALGIVITFLTLRTWTFANAGFIVYNFFINLLIFSLIKFNIRKKNRKNVKPSLFA